MHASLAILLALAGLLGHGVRAGAGYSLDPAALRPVLEAAMRCQNIRQLHAAAVHRDTEIYSVRLEMLPGGEIRDIADTRLLQIASISKGMFGTALVRVEQHLRTVLNNPAFSLFTTPIKRLIGDEKFWFLDHVRSDLVTIDDLISHRTGLDPHDSMWSTFEWRDKQDLADHASRLSAKSDFRNSFLYNNVVWTVADLAVQKLTNRSFVSYMREFLWRPLGMEDTRSLSELSTGEMLSLIGTADGRQSGRPFELSKMERAGRLVEAAGGIATSLSDMMKYMRLHATRNYSAYQPVPEQFRPLNSLAAESGFNRLFNRQIYNDDVINVPEFEIESYGRGWMRTWYRDNLAYSHGGHLLGARSELDIFTKQNLAVFNNMALGSPVGLPYQTIYAAIINKHMADLLLGNRTFVTRENVCSLLRSPGSPIVSRIPRRHLTEDDVDAIKGSYGNYGFGTVVLTYNQTTKTMRAEYGLVRLELIPVQRVLNQPEPRHFLVHLLEPAELTVSVNVLLNRTDEEVFVPAPALNNPQAFLTVSRGQEGRLALEAGVFQSGMLLTRGLDPGTWTRPEPCDRKSTGPGASAGGRWATLAAAVAALAVLAAA